MLLDDLKKFNIILASQSPRRKELLSQMGLEFTVADNYDVDEKCPEQVLVEESPWFISKLKSENYPLPLADNDIIITADTLVIWSNNAFGKPNDRKEAIDMLSLLSGNTHKVITGVTLKSQNHVQSFSELSEVSFRSLKEEEIIHYVDTYKPYDKAGAYAIQEWIGMVGIDNINGSYYNIMGLPTETLFRQLSLFITKVAI